MLLRDQEMVGEQVRGEQVRGEQNMVGEQVRGEQEMVGEQVRVEQEMDIMSSRSVYLVGPWEPISYSAF